MIYQTLLNAQSLNSSYLRRAIPIVPQVTLIYMAVAVHVTSVLDPGTRLAQEHATTAPKLGCH